MRRVGKPNGKVTLLDTYDIDHNNHIVYSVGVDESGQYYSVEEHEYNIGSSYSVAAVCFILEDSEVKDLRRRATVMGYSKE
jgi:hypothetical protein